MQAGTHLLSETKINSTETAPILMPVWQRLHGRLQAALEALQNPVTLVARFYVAEVFFASGLTKLRDWGTTVALFTEEYKVPILPLEWAAWLGTTGEIVLPVMLLLGLLGRIPALGLSVVNIVAVISLSEIAPAALQQHISWGIVLAALAIFGSGKWVADRLIARGLRKFARR